MAKTLSTSDIDITHDSGEVVSPFDCSTGKFDNNNSYDGGGHDLFTDDYDTGC